MITRLFGLFAFRWTKSHRQAAIALSHSCWSHLTVSSPYQVQYREQMCTVRPNIQQWSTVNYFNVLLTILSPFLADDIISYYLYKTHLYNWEKKFTLLVSSRIFQTCTWKALGKKVILNKGGRSNVFNLTLMNKLMRIEWVSEWVSEWVIECHSSAPKSPWHDYVIHELKKRFLICVKRVILLLLICTVGFIIFSSPEKWNS